MAKYPTYAPEFQIKVNGDRIPAALRGCVTRVSYQDGLEGADRVEVTLANEDLRWLDHPLLQMDNGFWLSIGLAPDPRGEGFAGGFNGANAPFPKGGWRRLTSLPHDSLQRLPKARRIARLALRIPCIEKFPL